MFKEIRTSGSTEAQLDRRIEELIAKLVDEHLSPVEEATLSQLVAQRSRMMRRAVTSPPKRFSRMRLSA